MRKGKGKGKGVGISARREQGAGDFRLLVGPEKKPDQIWEATASSCCCRCCCRKREKGREQEQEQQLQQKQRREERRNDIKGRRSKANQSEAKITYIGPRESECWSAKPSNLVPRATELGTRDFCARFLPLPLLQDRCFIAGQSKSPNWRGEGKGTGETGLLPKIARLGSFGRCPAPDGRPERMRALLGCTEVFLFLP
ncbi:hypothetical protein C4D60_Mb08t11120 [Musa balbisiana]|uniref:Uncharacterized protein n=1 Tax=Musa balbisiana TaxID=52838 RepID=A0A4S8K2X9_MUSBA|nr:hypothetical protein C4D60_Mb08t11120 [Musa balbisiana]